MMRFGLKAALAGAAVLACWAFGPTAPAPEAVAADAKPTYAKDIQPILAKNCYGCHNPRKKKAGVDLQSGYAGVARIVKPEAPEESRLFKCLVGKGAKLMPPKRPLPQETVPVVKAWIADGAKEK